MIATGALAILSSTLAAALLAQGPHAASGRNSASRTTASATAHSSSAATKHNANRAKPEASEAASEVANAAETTTDKGEGAKTEGNKAAKTRTYTFGAMDVEGKMKTPQLLYFLNRVKLELEMSAPDKKSFMKDLEHSADDSSL